MDTKSSETSKLMMGDGWDTVKGKYRIVRGKTRLTLRNKRGRRPGIQVARRILEQYCRDLGICQECESRYVIQIHHIDGNPWNNRIENLAVLCRRCHGRRHNIDYGVIDEYEGIPYADESGVGLEEVV